MLDRIRKMADYRAISWAPGSLGFLAILTALSAIGAILWSTLVLKNNNLERQGIDIANHAVWVFWEGNALPSSLLGAGQAYPKCAHWLGARFMPLFDGNAIQAMRCAALLALLITLSAQYTFICRFTPPLAATCILFVWQWLCLSTRFGDLDCCTTNYFYPQAMGTVGYWIALVFVTQPTQTLIQKGFCTAIAEGAAIFAYECHIVPGLVAFGTLAVFQSLTCVQERNCLAGVWLLLTLAATGAAVLGSHQWQFMASARNPGNDGWLPYEHLWLLLTWIPTLGISLRRFVPFLSRPKERRGLPAEELVLCSGLLVTGLVQAYFVYEWLILQVTSAYTVKKLFFFNFPLASLLWFFWLTSAGSKLARVRQIMGSRWLRGRAVRVALGTLLVSVGLYQVSYKDAQRPAPEVAQDPVHVAALLGKRRESLRQCYYYDPQYPMGALFATVTGLHLRHDVALKCWQAFYFRRGSPADPSWHGRIVEILLPLTGEPRAVFGVSVPTVNDGEFLHCDVRGLGRTKQAQADLSGQSHP